VGETYIGKKQGHHAGNSDETGVLELIGNIGSKRANNEAPVAVEFLLPHFHLGPTQAVGAVADRVADQAESHVVGQGQAGLQMHWKKWVYVIVDTELVDRKHVGVDA